MANKLKVYKVEDTRTGKIINVEGPEGASEDEIYAFLEENEGPVVSPAEPPVAAGPSGVQSPQGVQSRPSNNNYETAIQPTYDTAPEPLNDIDAAEYLRLSKDPSVSIDAIGQWLGERGKSLPSGAGQVLDEYRRGVAAGNYNDTIGYQSAAKALLPPVDQENASAVEDFLGTTDTEAVLEEGMAYNPMNKVKSFFDDWTDADLEGGITMEALQQQYPYLDKDALEELHDGVIGEQMARQKTYASGDVDRRGVNPVARVAGNFVTGTSPVDIIPLGRGATFGARAFEGVVANSGLDGVDQAVEIAYGAREGFDPMQNAGAMVAGAAFQGAAEGIMRGARVLAKVGPKIVNALPKKAVVPESRAPIAAPVAREGTKKYQRELTKTAEGVRDRVDELTNDWEKRPDISVVEDLGVDPDSGRAKVGVTNEDGSITLSAKGIVQEAKNRDLSLEDMTSAVTFHEGLGHYGLAQEFDDSLREVLDGLYNNGSTTFKEKVDGWLEKNPDAYKGEADRHIAAAEEVLAGWSEKGRIPVTILDKMANKIKDLGRKMGLTLSYSEREIKSILGMVHKNVIEGGRPVKTLMFRQPRNMVTYHGSPHDFDAFDHSKMGTGEGNQSYGWGTYISEKEVIARGYRDRLTEGGEFTFTDKNGEQKNLPKWFNDDDFTDALGLSNSDPNRYPAIYAANEMARGATLDEALETAAKDYSHYSNPEVVKAVLEKVRKSGLELQGRGKLYEVVLPDDAKWLEWDKPLSAHSPEVKEILRDKLGFDEQTFGDYTGEQMYNAIAWDNNVETDADFRANPEAASKAFDEAGITGNRYLDGMSRRQGEGTYNYVIYNDKTPKIIKKYMLASDPEEEVSVKHAKEILDSIEGFEPRYRSWEEAKGERRARGITANSMKKLEGVGDLDKRLFQYDAVAEQTNSNLLDQLDKRDRGEFTVKDQVKLLKTMVLNNQLMAHIEKDQAEYGRGLNAFKALTYTKRKIVALKDLLEEYQGGNLSAFGDPRVFDEFADKLRFLLQSGNTAGAQNMIRSISKPYWWQYVLTFRHSMMLSSVGTQVKNTADSGLMIIRELQELATAIPGTPIRKGLKAVGKALPWDNRAANLQDGVSATEVAARMYGLLQATFDGSTYANAWDALKKGHGNTVHNSKIEMQDARIPVLSKVADLLHASDTFFRAFHMNANLYTLGVRKAQGMGFKGPAAFAEGSNFARNPTSEMLDEAKQMSDTALLVDTPSAPTASLEAWKAIKPGMSGGKQASAALANFIFMFFRVTDRILFARLRRTPLSFLDNRTREDWKAGGPRADTAVARTLYGSALIALYWAEAGTDELEGKGPADYDKQKALEAGGWMPNSVKEGDKYVDASALNFSLLPWDTQNALAANIASIREAYDKGLVDENDTGDALGAASMALMSVISSNSFAENLSPYLEPFGHGEAYSKDAALSNMIAGAASQFVPAAARQANQMYFDPQKRDTTGDKSIMGGIPGFGGPEQGRVLGRVMSGIPGLSDNLPQKHDVYGDEMKYGRTLSSINNYQPIKNDPVSKELQRLERTTDKAVVRSAPSSFQHNGETVKLSAAGKQEWQRIQGGYLRRGMESVIRSDEWKQATDAEKIVIVKEVKSEAYDMTKAEMLPQLGFEEGEE